MIVKCEHCGQRLESKREKIFALTTCPRCLRQVSWTVLEMEDSEVAAVAAQTPPQVVAPPNPVVAPPVHVDPPQAAVDQKQIRLPSRSEPPTGANKRRGIAGPMSTTPTGRKLPATLVWGSVSALTLAVVIFCAVIYMLKTQRIDPKVNQTASNREGSTGSGSIYVPSPTPQNKQGPTQSKPGSAEMWRTDLVQNLADLSDTLRDLKDSRVNTQSWIRTGAKECLSQASKEETALEAAKARLKDAECELKDQKLNLTKVNEQLNEINAKEPPYSTFLRLYAEYDDKAQDAISISQNQILKSRELEKADAAYSQAQEKLWDAAASVEVALDDDARTKASEEFENARREAESAKAKLDVLQKDFTKLSSDLVVAEKASSVALDAMKKVRAKLDSSSKAVKDFLAAVDAHEEWLVKRRKAFEGFLKARNAFEKANFSADQVRAKMAKAETLFKVAEKKYKRAATDYEIKYDNAAAEHNKQNGNPDWQGVRAAEDAMKRAQTERDDAAKARDQAKSGSKEPFDAEKTAKKAYGDAERAYIKIDDDIDNQIKALATAIKEAEAAFSTQLSAWKSEHDSAEAQVETCNRKIESADEKRTEYLEEVESCESRLKARKADAALWNKVADIFSEDPRERACATLLEDLTTFSTQATAGRTQAVAFAKRAKFLVSEFEKGDPSLFDLSAADAQAVKDRGTAISNINRRLSVLVRTLESIR